MQTPATLMRGGTSKCWLFDHRDVPDDRVRLEDLLIELFGAEDPRQLDGVGGGTSVTSKAAVVMPSADPDVDVDFLFAQVAIGAHRVEWGSNCGNCATAVALWAVDKLGLSRGESHTEVRMRNLNTNAVIHARVATPSASSPARFDSVSVPGVRGTGTAVDLAFVDPAGSTTGSLWPTGKHRDSIVVDGIRVDISMADAGAPVALVRADSLGVSAAATEEQLQQYVPMLRHIRARAAVAMGLATSIETAPDAIPKVGLVGPAVPYCTTLGEDVDAADYDISVRMLSMNAPHPTIGLTSAVAVALAARSGDSTVGFAGAAAPANFAVTIGTLGGRVRCTVERDGGHERVLLQRAARRIAESTLYSRDRLSA
ncbi:PrpF domain-containing protein [Rhodococcus wratislaviensis]|uniref:PrpF domain-containing protein n=1 Tax=Rhodococcus wratislaviensis TaxID=44752 RepID=UPI0035116B6D